jgi:hypothetical protein
MDTEALAVGQHQSARISPGPGAPRCLEQLGQLSWIPVETELQGERWDRLMDDEHFLGAGPLVGRRLRYLVVSSRLGEIAALSFSAAAWRLQPRDAFIGWCSHQREAHLQRVVANSRFLIRGEIQVPELASHVLAHTLRRLPRDWARRYGETPVLVETFVDRARHRGGCYRAANWIYVGDTQGRGRNDRANDRPRTPKAVYLYPLGRHWRVQLGGAKAATVEPPVDDWARHELAHARCGDQRLHERVIAVTRDFAAHSEAAPPEACGTRTRTKAAYRLLANPRVTMQELIRSHAQATAGRCRDHEVVLAVQDTTTLNYSAPTITEGLGPIGSRAHGAQGLIVHDTMAFTPEGTPLGLIDGQAWARRRDDHGLRRLADDDRDVDDKESSKWLASHGHASRLQAQLPASRVVSVADREGDLYELLTAAQQPEAADGLVRARHDRRLAGSGQSLTAYLNAQAPAAVELNIAQRSHQPARIARLAVRYQRVTLQAPKGKRRLGPVELDAVQASEIDPPEGVKGLNWTLLTTVATPTAQAACERLQWYATRWQIEVYHRTLKSGCRIQERNLGDAERIETALAIDMVIAWRTFWLTKWGRERRDTPASALLEPDEWKALLVRTDVAWDPGPDDEPTLYRAMHLIAGLGGYQDRKREPATQTIWRGLQRIEDMTQVFAKVRAAARGEMRPP